MALSHVSLTVSDREGDLSRPIGFDPGHLELEERIGAAPAAYVAELLRRVHSGLGERLVGAWLLGSAAMGDFSPERSDIDIQAVAGERLPRSARLELAEALCHEALPCPARGLEFVLYAQEDLTAPGGPAFQLNLNSGERMERHVALEPSADPRFWFIVDLSIGRQHGVPLAGPPATTVFPELPCPLVVAALLEALDWYESAGLGAETVLSACRSWAWAGDGLWRSQAEAGRWARPRLTDPDAVDRALLLRERPGGPAPEEAGVRAVIDAARAALA